MIDIGMAELFIKKLSEYTEYNINIMNEKGIIIASKDPSRIGVFHEIAYTIITSAKNIIEIESDDEFLGVKSGVNLLLEYKGEKIGVLGITGNPQEINPIAQALKLSVEVMYELQIIQSVKLQKKSVKERFINNLLFNEEMDSNELLKDAQALGYKDNIVRVPIIMAFEEDLDTKPIINLLKTTFRNTNTIIVDLVRKNKVILFLHYNNSPESFFSIYKETIENQLYDIFKYIKSEEILCSFYIGPVQRKFIYYRFSYQKCLWMGNNIDTNDINSDIKMLYFYDYMDQYLKHLLPITELHNIFGTLNFYYTKEFRETFISHIKALYDNNYNIIDTSKQLFVHKNTLVFRINKIKEFLGINPIHNSKDRYLAEYLYYYFKSLK